MKRHLLALALGVLVLLLVGAGTATAGLDPFQGTGQSAGSQQDAGSAAGTAQQGPTNQNTPIRVLSPGEAGSVAQSNDASSNATAGNANGTSQTADQSQAGGPGVQAVGQSATNDQDALALALTLQKDASNENTPVRVLDDGEDGSVSQSNEASSDATAGNVNGTEQTAGQDRAGAGGTQIVGQAAGNEQDAAALSATVQESPSNTNGPVGVLSSGDGGSVEQSNEATSNATAGNLNGTTQTADQAQRGGPSPCGCGSKSPGAPGSQPTADICGCPVAGAQIVGQSADNAQEAGAVAFTEQSGASNENISVRVLSPGNNGSVTQSNVASSNAAAGNVNGTSQSADQGQGGSGSQNIGQSASNEQSAAALSGTVQENPSNTNISVRVLSPGNDGDVEQSNVATSNATAANVNGTSQSADQTQAGGSDSCKCGSAGSQVIGQSADNHQGALAGSLTVQEGAKNENISVRVLSPGNNGSVTQSNVASSNAAAGNANGTHQTADQTQAGGSCKCGAGTQLIGQSASNAQAAAAFSATIQEKPSNSNIPIRVLSEGDDGDVTQSNVATSNATAANLNGTAQSANQSQAGGSGIQVIGQESSSGQLAIAAALTAQLGASNENAPVRVLSHGNGGSVSQSNTASSNANAGNANRTGQNAVQEQGGRHDGCCGKGIQAIGQSSQNWQAAKSVALTLQLGIEQPCRCGHGSEIGNSNSPTRVLSQGDDGSVRQSNNASSNAQAANWNATTQAADQLQNRPDSCRCKAGTGIQAIGQLDTSSQAAAALAASLQLGAENEWAPDRKSSPGNWGGLFQNERNAAHDLSGSRSATDQSRSQGRG
jgi:hypothetical protein